MQKKLFHYSRKNLIKFHFENSSVVLFFKFHPEKMEQLFTEAAQHTYANVFTIKTICTHTFWNAAIILANLVASTRRVAF